MDDWITIDMIEMYFVLRMGIDRNTPTKVDLALDEISIFSLRENRCWLDEF